MNNNDFYIQMKENEEYIVWEPENITSSCASYHASYTEVIDGEEHLRFVIHGEDMTIELIFSGFVLSYMYSDEFARMMSWATAQEKYNDKRFFGKSPSPVYKIENSVFIKWIMTESCGFYPEADLTHYCIVTQNDVVDIISMCEPTYRIISNLNGDD